MDSIASIILDEPNMLNVFEDVWEEIKWSFQGCEFEWCLCIINSLNGYGLGFLNFQNVISILMVLVCNCLF